MPPETIVVTTSAADKIDSGVVGLTPEGQPNVIVKTFNPLIKLSVKSTIMFLSMVLGSLTVNGLSAAFVGGAFGSFLKDIILIPSASTFIFFGYGILGILNDWDQKHPNLG